MEILGIIYQRLHGYYVTEAHLESKQSDCKTHYV